MTGRCCVYDSSMSTAKSSRKHNRQQSIAINGYISCDNEIVKYPSTVKTELADNCKYAWLCHSGLLFLFYVMMSFWVLSGTSV